MHAQASASNVCTTPRARAAATASWVIMVTPLPRTAGVSTNIFVLCLSYLYKPIKSGSLFLFDHASEILFPAAQDVCVTTSALDRTLVHPSVNVTVTRIMDNASACPM